MEKSRENPHIPAYGSHSHGGVADHRRECAGSPCSSPSLSVQLSTDVATCSPPTRRGVTGPEVAAGPSVPVDVRANVPAAGSQILPDRTRAACDDRDVRTASIAAP